MAILAGDLMQGWAFELIDQSDVRPEVKLKAAAELRHYGYIRLVSGEAVDVAMSYCRAEDITEAELFEMQSGKTGALLHYAARAGWMLGREDAGAWDDAEAKALGEFGEKLALAFQMRDDYLGIFGSPYPPSGSSQCTSPKHPVPCIEPGLATRFIHDIIHVSMLFSQISPPSPSPTESIRLIYTSVSLLLSRTQGYCYHLSKFHIYALVYCIGVFLSGLLHSV